MAAQLPSHKTLNLSNYPKSHIKLPKIFAASEASLVDVLTILQFTKALDPLSASSPGTDYGFRSTTKLMMARPILRTHFDYGTSSWLADSTLGRLDDHPSRVVSVFHFLDSIPPSFSSWVKLVAIARSTDCSWRIGYRPNYRSTIRRLAPLQHRRGHLFD